MDKGKIITTKSLWLFLAALSVLSINYSISNFVSVESGNKDK